MSVRARRVWWVEMSLGGLAAPSARRSSKTFLRMSQQTSLGLYGAAHGIRRAVPAQGARARPSSRGDPGTRRPSAIGAHHAPDAGR